MQLEQSQITYMRETRPYDYAPDRAEASARVVRSAIETALGRLDK